MGKILSIIVPTYNMQDYLDRCLKSLIVNSDLLEVLIINDGSKDQSLAIAKRYEKEHPNIFRVIDKSNGNYGSCVNRGLHEATGKYVKVLNADDQFRPEALNILLQEASTTDVDAFITNYVKSPISGKAKTVTFDLPQGVIIPFTEICNHKDIINLWMHAITYKRENLLQIGYKQTEGISYTDQEWIFEPLSTVRTLMYIPQDLYIYTLGREGQTMSKDFSACHFEDNITCAKQMLTAYTHLQDIPLEIKVLLAEKLFKRIKYIYKFCLAKSKNYNQKSLLEFDQQLKATCQELYDRSNQIVLSRPLFPYKYIKLWRNSPNGVVFNLLIHAYRATKF